MFSLSSVQSLSCVWLFSTPWTAAQQASLSITNSWSLLKLVSIESVMPSNHLILCRPLLLLPSVFPSIRVFSLHSWWSCCTILAFFPGPLSCTVALLLSFLRTQLFPSYLPGWTCDSEANWEERNGDSALWPCVFTCEWGNCFSFLGHTAKPQTTEIYSLSDLEMWGQKSRWWQGPALSKGLKDSLLFALFSYWWSSHPLTCGSISVSVVPLQPPLLPWLHSSQLPWLHSYKITCQGI